MLLEAHGPAWVTKGPAVLDEFQRLVSTGRFTPYLLFHPPVPREHVFEAKWLLEHGLEFTPVHPLTGADLQQHKSTATKSAMEHLPISQVAAG